MSDGDEVVGHKTFSTGDPMRPFRHEPLTKSEADAIWKSCEDAKNKRAADMPTDKDAINAMWGAYQRLLELGWEESRYANKLKQDMLTSEFIELGSTGIHEGYYHKVNETDVWWSGEEGYPCHPCLIRGKP